LVAVLLSCALVVVMGLTWFRARHPPVAPIGGSTLIEGTSPAARSDSPTGENVNPPAAAVTVATRPRTRAATQTPEQVVAESVPPSVTAPAEEPADSPITAPDSAAPNATLELTPPVHIDPAPAIARTESTTASPPRTEKVTTPVRIKTIAPTYPGVARAAQIEGDVVLQAFIDPRGRVTDVTVTRSVHPLLDEAARQAVLRYEYAPGRRGGIPESSTARIIVSFKLQ